MTLPSPYAAVGAAAWRWVLDQVRWDDGPWVPVTVTDPAQEGPAWDRDGLHSGVGGLAPVLAELRLTRAWTDEERTLADGIADRLHRVVPEQTDCTYFDGLVSSLGVLLALDGDPTPAVARLLALAEPDGWPQTVLTGPRYLPGARVNDLTLGTAGVLIGALWARRHGTPGATELAEHAARVLVAEAEPEQTGVGWRMVPPRFCRDLDGLAVMPNLSHGVAGVATALALAGVELARPDLTALAVQGAEHLVSLGDLTEDGFVVPRYLPRDFNDQDEITFTWCHGGTGTSLFFLALERAGVTEVAGRPPLEWHRRLLHEVRTSGLPARLHPGFWDNDGRCCGTAGVADVLLDCWQRASDPDDLAFAVTLGDTLVERAIVDGPHACWRFLEHHDDDPLRPPGVGWMQGTAGIAAVLLRLDRVLRDGPEAAAVPRMDSWWTLPEPPEASVAPTR